MWNTAQTSVVKTRLRRSLSDHVKDSTNKAWDGFWRSVRERRLWEIEAKEACDWLRAAGFPQYVQLFKDCRFPIDTEAAKEDHSFLDKDSLDSLCRRLMTLNKCMEIKLELWRSKHRGEDWEEEDYCAISPNWTYDRRTQQWRRMNSSEETPDDHQDVCSVHSSSLTDSERHNAHRELVSTSRNSSRSSSANRTPSLDTSYSGPPSPNGGSSTVSLEAEVCFREKPPRKKCTTLLRKMEKLRLRGAAGGHLGTRRDVSGTVLVRQRERVYRQLRTSNLQVQSSSHSSSSPSSSHTISSGSSSTSQSENSSTVSTPSPVTRVRANCKRSNSGVGMQSDQNQMDTEVFKNQVNSNNNSSHDRLIFQVPHGHKPGTFPTSLAHKHILSPIIDSNSVNWRTGSFHGYRARHGSRRGPSSLVGGDQSPASLSTSSGRTGALDHRLSVYDNVPHDTQLSEGEGGGSESDAERISEESEVSPLLADEDVFSALDGVLERISDLQQLVVSWSENISEDDCHRGSSSSSHDSPVHGSPCPASPSHIHLEVQHPEEEDEEEEDCTEKVTDVSEMSGSPQSKRRVSWSRQQNRASLTSGLGLEIRSASQILQLQKLSLLKLTALMDKYSPSSKQGWSWTVPKTMTKTKATAEVKGRQVFGVPLLVIVQQTGEPLPPCILRALVYLRAECLDQLGLFRKPGVKSRIQYLREMIESDPDGFSFEGQSAFDVADMVKQYFRDLPEPIFTSKLCETFLHIYQYFPKDQQLVAAQAAILLLPDENREALRTLLFFLRDVAACVDENQMTPTNVAVCLAPSLFHLNTIKRESKAARSGHRKYSLGRPDQRDLSENLAATQGLSIMITEAHRLFQLPEFWPGQSLIEDWSEGGDEDLEERRNRLQQRTQQLLSDAQDKSGGWENHPAPQDVELAYKKMSDGCPLWTWRGCVEVAAPQQELLQRLLREQPLWEANLRRAAVVRALSKDAEVYRYTLQGRGHALGSQPPQETLVLRTWQADPSCGPVYLSSMSTEVPEVQADGVRVQVHCCLYLLEPTGAIRTRLTHLCRTDTRGRSPDWHKKVSGRLLVSGLLAIRDSFRTEYKETKI